MKNDVIGAVLGVIAIIAFFYELRPRQTFKGGIRRKAHSRAKIISDTEILVTNLDDVNAWEMDRLHVSMLKVRTRLDNGRGDWVYTFDKPMGPMGSDSEQMMYMREAEGMLNNYIDRYVNPAKDNLE